MKKQLPALLAALSITLCIGLGMLAIGAGALFNRNGVALQNSPGSNYLASNNVSSSSDHATIEQLQTQVSQYQAQQQQYQQQIEQDAQQLQQYQLLMQYLQQRGVIQVDQNGRVYVP